MEPARSPKSGKHPSAQISVAAGPSSPDDQSRTWDGRVLNSKAAVLQFLAEIEDARGSGRSLDPHDNLA